MMTNYDILKEYEAHKTPVPSYEEWQRTFHYAGKYEHEYTSCVMDYENLKQENTKLKELLLACQAYFTEDYEYKGKSNVSINELFDVEKENNEKDKLADDLKQLVRDSAKQAREIIDNWNKGVD